MTARERAFYEKLTTYLQEGDGVAGLEAKTPSRQRAVGFVRPTFQKIMSSSSPRAIRQALRRRLFVLVAREQMDLSTRQQTRHDC